MHVCLCLCECVRSLVFVWVCMMDSTFCRVIGACFVLFMFSRGSPVVVCSLRERDPFPHCARARLGLIAQIFRRVRIRLRAREAAPHQCSRRQ